MKLTVILQDSGYKLSQFPLEKITALEKRVNERDGKHYASCLVRKKEIRVSPEEIVRQLYLAVLLDDYGYPAERIELEYQVSFGREKKRADIVILDKDNPTAPYIIVELKKPKLKDGKEQLKSYCNATGAPIGVWTNGDQISFYHRKDPNFFEDLPQIPAAQEKLSDIITERWTIDDLIKKDKLITERKSLKDLILEMENEVLANAGVDVFEELFKLIFTKLYDEMQSGNNKTRHLTFRNCGDTETELKEKIQTLFNKAKNKWDGVFSKDAKITLSPSHLSICVSSLQDVKLFNSNLEVIDEAFEYLINKNSKGEKGQYFTPRYVIDMCVKMLNPKETETMIDTAAGSCGFPVHTIFYVWEQILKRKGLQKSHLFTLENKPQECTDYVNEKVFAIDFDERAVRVARTLNLIAGDGQTNVMHLNTIDYERWDEKIKDEEWIDTYNNGWKKLRKLRAKANENREFAFDILMANPPFAGDIKETRILAKYELGKNSQGKYQNTLGRDILFIERNLDFLKPGGRMAVVLPQGRFNNSSDKYIREFIAERYRILAVVGLHGNVFKPHTGTKTSVLFLQKWDENLCPKKEDYPIFFATMQSPSKDNSGDKIYEDFYDAHGHYIVKHDLFNTEGLTRDGVAEAFIEFAKKEKLSFFLNSPFDKRKYERLLKGLEISEVKISYFLVENSEFRLDAEYFSKDNVKMNSILDKIGFRRIGEFSTVTDGIHESIDYSETSAIKLVSATSPRENYFDFSRNVFISEQAHIKNPRTALVENDVIISTVGTIGNCAVVKSSDLPANSDRHVGIIRIKDTQFLPNYVSTFLISKYGRFQTMRESTGNVQLNLFIYKIKELKIANLALPFQREIEKTVKQAHAKREQSLALYREAEALLLESIGLKNFKANNENTNTKNFSQSFGATGRLDAEYYQKKYEDYESLVKKYQGGYALARELFNQNETLIDYSAKQYNYIEIGDINTSNGSYSYNAIETEELPANAKIKSEKGNILISKVRPNRGAVSIIQDDIENLVVSGAFTVFEEKTDYKKETLFVLLRTTLYREWLLRFNVGTSYPVIKDSDVLHIPLPLVDAAAQERIARLIQKSFALRQSSESLLADAKTMVEREIEKP